MKSSSPLIEFCPEPFVLHPLKALVREFEFLSFERRNERGELLHFVQLRKAIYDVHYHSPPLDFVIDQRENLWQPPDV